MEADGQQEIAGWHVTDVSIAHVPILTPEEEESHHLFHAAVVRAIDANRDDLDDVSDFECTLTKFAAVIWAAAFKRAEQVLAAKDGT